MLCPSLAPFLHELSFVPVAGLRAKAVFVHFPHRQHDMGVGLHHAVCADVPVDIEVGDHPALDKFLADKITGQVDALLLTQFARNREFDFARKLRVFP